MAKCTGMRCPMQYGYNVEECNQTDCPYRTEPITNADRIRAMSNEQLAKLFMDFAVNCYNDCGVSAEIITTDYVMEWLKQPAEE